MASVIRNNTVKIRKKRTCFACGRVFEVGSTMCLYVVEDGGNVYNCYECPTCSELLNKYPNHFEEYGEFYPNCVDGACEKGETPEDLLVRLNKEKEDILKKRLQIYPIR